LRLAPLKSFALLLTYLVVACGSDSPPTDASGGAGGRASAGGSGASGGTRNAGGASGTAGSGTAGGSSTAGSSTAGSSTGGSSTAGKGGGAGRGGSSAGGAGTGGSNGGGSGTTVVIPPSGCTEAERMVCNNQTQMHCGYTSEYWKDQGTGCMLNTADGFSIDWSNVNNLLARKGIRPGSADLVVTFDAEYQPDGNSYLNVYGWMQNPLAEYYIVDSWGNWRPPGATAITTIQSDGGSYEIYRTERMNAPSIEGNKNFPQYWSVRTQKRERGTITVGNHFSAWQSNGMTIGRLYEVSFNVEGYQSSGVAEVRMLIE
jgi:endo-1,4-beta-xylanase